jgi:hypothetical protein
VYDRITHVLYVCTTESAGDTCPADAACSAPSFRAGIKINKIYDDMILTSNFGCLPCARVPERTDTEPARDRSHSAPLACVDAGMQSRPSPNACSCCQDFLLSHVQMLEYYPPILPPPISLPPSLPPSSLPPSLYYEYRILCSFSCHPSLPSFLPPSAVNISALTPDAHERRPASDVFKTSNGPQNATPRRQQVLSPTLAPRTHLPTLHSCDHPRARSWNSITHENNAHATLTLSIDACTQVPTLERTGCAARLGALCSIRSQHAMGMLSIVLQEVGAFATSVFAKMEGSVESGS